MRNLIVALMVLVFTSAASLAGCSGKPDRANTAANSESPNIFANTNGPNSDTGKNKYPQPVGDEFVRACEGAGAKRDLCECVFEKVQQQYSFAEFAEIGKKIKAGQPPEDFVEFSDEARVECTK